MVVANYSQVLDRAHLYNVQSVGIDKSTLNTEGGAILSKVGVLVINARWVWCETIRYQCNGQTYAEQVNDQLRPAHRGLE